MSKTVDYGKLRSVYSWNSNEVKERGARALRDAAVKERNARSRSPDEINQHRRGVLEGAGSKADVCRAWGNRE
jgi:hypothetical protein